MIRLLCICFFFLIALGAAEVPKPDLVQIEKEIQANPENPTLHYRKCQALFAQGKEQAAIDHAGITLQKFIAAKEELAWMKLGSIKTETLRIDVHFNMGPKERAIKKNGIVRPYSFRIWSRDGEKLIRVLDFEQGWFDGKHMTTALGEMEGHNHENYGILENTCDFATVRAKVLEIVEPPKPKDSATLSKITIP